MTEFVVFACFETRKNFTNQVSGNSVFLIC